MSNVIDPVYFKALAERDPEILCKNALCSYDNEERSYTLSVWDEDFVVKPVESKILKLSDSEYEVDILLGLTIIYYLLYSKDIRITGEWISEKDIPGGTTFFTGPHTIPTGLIDKKFPIIADFNSRCERLSGKRLDMGDAAYSFRILPRVPVAIIYWKGDDEYPVQSKLLYDRSITKHLTPDIIFGMAVEVCRKFAL